jgi:hypothetical protein
MVPAVTPIDVTLFGTVDETQQRLDQDAGDRLKIRKSGKGDSLNRHHAVNGSIKDGPSSRGDETRGDTG